MNMKLELKHLAPYLPYYPMFRCLEIESEEYELLPLLSIDLTNGSTTVGIGNTDYSLDDIESLEGEDIKLVLRPLSDLTKEIQIAEHYMSFREHLKRIYPSETAGLNPAAWSHRSIEWLLERHFDVFGLIGQGLAIDINTLTK